jgi:hypothetical protein
VYPTVSQCGFYFGNKSNYGDITFKFHQQIKYLLSKSNLMSHYNNRRFSLDNLLPHFFSVFATGCVDSLPIRVRQPSASVYRYPLYSGKYKTCVVKFQVICDHLGHVLSFHGPYSGLDYDSTIWEKSYHQLNLWVDNDSTNPEHLHRFETVIGDCHYMNGSQCTVPFVKPGTGSLSETETLYDNYVSYVRATIERVIGYVKYWSILGTIYRGMLHESFGYNMLCDFFRLIIELYNRRFYLFGHNKRNIVVIKRDHNNNPICQPDNFTPENIRVRQNLHHQLQSYKSIKDGLFFKEADIVSGNNTFSLSTGDSVWVFIEKSQSFLKGNIMGFNQSNNTFSVRSSNKKNTINNIPPNIIFQRQALSNIPPDTCLHSSIARMPQELLYNDENDNKHCVVRGSNIILNDSIGNKFCEDRKNEDNSRSDIQHQLMNEEDEARNEDEVKSDSDTDEESDMDISNDDTGLSSADIWVYLQRLSNKKRLNYDNVVMR